MMKGCTLALGPGIYTMLPALNRPQQGQSIVLHALSIMNTPWYVKTFT